MITSQNKFKDKSIQIYQADILTTTIIQPGSVDLIVTSPPYNVDIQYNSHDDTMIYQDYLTFTEKWLRRKKREDSSHA